MGKPGSIFLQLTILAVALLSVHMPGACAGRSLFQQQQWQQNRSTVSTTSAEFPVYTSIERYRDNIAYLGNEALPVGWKLNTVLKWDAYGHGINKLAPVAVQQKHPISLLYNYEAEAIKDLLNNTVLVRIRPANYTEIVEAIKEGYGFQEFMGPTNQADLTKAAKDTNTTIPVHIYLYKHYGAPWGFEYTTSQGLQDLVSSLDPRYVSVVGIMAHSTSYPYIQEPGVIANFLKTACPVAAQMAPKHVILHYAASNTVTFYTPSNSTRMVPPAGPTECSVDNIEWWARVGQKTYGTNAYANEVVFKNSVKPVMLWNASVQSIELRKLQDNYNRVVAVVNLSPARYPTVSWWTGIDAYRSINTSADNPRTLDQPDAYVYINGEKFHLAEIPTGDGSVILIDVTEASRAVREGDKACLLCDDHTLDDMADELGTFNQDVARCLHDKKGFQPSDPYGPRAPNCTAWGS